jgi:hypothetical protein
LFEPLSLTPITSDVSARQTVTWNRPPLPVAVCSRALVASSLTSRTASSRTGQGSMARRVKSRALAI